MSSAASIEQHGRIACGTITVSDLDQAVSAYRDFLAHEQVEAGEIDATLAAAWGAPNAANARYAILQAPTDAKSMLRLVEVPKQSHLHDHVPALSLGWNAFEITVRDVFALAERLADSPFDIVGPPKLVDGFTSFIPMQVFGPNGEVLFLNQVNHSDEDTDLPIAQSEVGETFIVVLASPDREASAAEYTEQLQMDLGGTHKLRYGLINRAFEFPEETQQTITMVQNGRTPFLQVDQYPAHALARAVPTGGLPMGNAMVTVLVQNLDELALQSKAVGPMVRPVGCLHHGRKTQVIKGLAGELIELIEIERL